MNVQRHTRRRIGALSNAKMMVALLDGAPVSALVEASGLQPWTVRSYVKALHKEGACYIDEWLPDSIGGHRIRSYRLGTQPDAKKPTKGRRAIIATHRAKRKHLAMLQATAGSASCN